eukprot:g2050.t1
MSAGGRSNAAESDWEGEVDALLEWTKQLDAPLDALDPRPLMAKKKKKNKKSGAQRRASAAAKAAAEKTEEVEEPKPAAKDTKEAEATAPSATSAAEAPGDAAEGSEAAEESGAGGAAGEEKLPDAEQKDAQTARKLKLHRRQSSLEAAKVGALMLKELRDTEEAKDRGRSASLEAAAIGAVMNEEFEEGGDEDEDDDLPPPAPPAFEEDHDDDDDDDDDDAPPPPPPPADDSDGEARDEFCPACDPLDSVESLMKPTALTDGLRSPKDGADSAKKAAHIRGLPTPQAPDMPAPKVCSNYRVDPTAAEFGQCICGYLKEAHKEKAVNKVAAAKAALAKGRRASVDRAKGGDKACDIYKTDTKALVFGTCLASVDRTKKEKACDAYKADTKAAVFGMCLCGWPKEDHEEKAINRAAEAKAALEAGNRRASVDRTKKEKACDAYKADTKAAVFGMCLCGWQKEDHEEKAENKVAAARAALEQGRRPSVDRTKGDTPCQQYKADVTASEFGICECGFSKEEHEAKAVNKVAEALQSLQSGARKGAEALERDEVCRPSNGPCASFKADLTAADFGICVCGFDRAAHREAEEEAAKAKVVDDTQKSVAGARASCRLASEAAAKAATVAESTRKSAKDWASEGVVAAAVEAAERCAAEAADAAATAKLAVEKAEAAEKKTRIQSPGEARFASKEAKKQLERAKDAEKEAEAKAAKADELAEEARKLVADHVAKAAQAEKEAEEAAAAKAEAEAKAAQEAKDQAAAAAAAEVAAKAKEQADAAAAASPPKVSVSDRSLVDVPLSDSPASARAAPVMKKEGGGCCIIA